MQMARSVRAQSLFRLPGARAQRNTMSEETQAAPSTAVVEAPQTFDIPRSGTDEYATWRNTGELPKVQPKTEDPAPSDTVKEQTTDEPGDSAPSTQEKQSKRRPDVEARIKQLTDRTKELEVQLEEARRPKETKADPSPAKPAQPQTYKDWRAEFKPQKWVEQYTKEHPDASYEDATAAMADHLGDVRDHFRAIEQQRQSQEKELNDKVSDA